MKMRKSVGCVALACVLLLGCASLVWAANNTGERPRGFYLRYLSPLEVASIDIDAKPEELSAVQQADALFTVLKSDNVYNQYIAVNRMVELYNDPELRARAVEVLQPFLSSEEPKLAESSAFALDILEQKFDSPLLCKMGDNGIYFTLFNNYSDYGSYNQLWRIKDDKLESVESFDWPLAYITDLLPSPDNKLLAISFCSNKGNFLIIRDTIKNVNIDYELMHNARVLYALELAANGVTNRFPQVRCDNEIYSGFGDLRWLDNTTVAFSASLSYADAEAERRGSLDFIEHVDVTYDCAKCQFTFAPIEKAN